MIEELLDTIQCSEAEKIKILLLLDMVRNEEREECARIADNLSEAVAKAIRARGEK